MGGGRPSAGGGGAGAPVTPIDSGGAQCPGATSYSTWYSRLYGRQRRLLPVVLPLLVLPTECKVVVRLSCFVGTGCFKHGSLRKVALGTTRWEIEPGFTKRFVVGTISDSRNLDYPGNLGIKVVRMIELNKKIIRKYERNNFF